MEGLPITRVKLVRYALQTYLKDFDSLDVDYEFKDGEESLLEVFNQIHELLIEVDAIEDEYYAGWQDDETNRLRKCAQAVEMDTSLFRKLRQFTARKNPCLRILSAVRIATSFSSPKRKQGQYTSVLNAKKTVQILREKS